MGYDRAASKRPVNMTLNEDLVRRARGLTTNLSETVETLLAGFVDAADAAATQRQTEIDEYVAAHNAFVAKHGSLADEFNTL
jgi:antitoxin CcdA